MNREPRPDRCILDAVAELPHEVVEQARAAGGGWYCEVVGTHRGEVPDEAVRGAWRLDAEGRLTGEYVANPRFGAGATRGGCPFHRQERS
jgi:hypothetical protein